MNSVILSTRFENKSFDEAWWSRGELNSRPTQCDCVLSRLSYGPEFLVAAVFRAAVKW